jgi:hypothetical protein
MAGTAAATSSVIKKSRKRAKSEQDVRVETAKNQLNAAEAQYERSRVPADKDKVSALAAALETELKKQARERFERIASARSSAALASLEGIGAIARSRKYLFIENDIARMFEPIREALERAESSLRQSLARDQSVTVSRRSRIVFEPLPIGSSAPAEIHAR